MHIPEGVLSAPVLIGGAATAVTGVAIGLYVIDNRNIVKVAVLSSAFFVASLIHVPVGVFSAHLVLNGLAGLLLGWAVFPALAVALLLQAILFGFGGLTTLGVNTTVMAFPGVCCYYLLNRPAREWQGPAVFFVGFAAGVLGIVLGAILLASVLMTTGREFTLVAGTVLLAHIPVMVIEGFVTGSALAFLRKVRPETLPGRARAPLTAEESAG